MKPLNAPQRSAAAKVTLAVFDVDGIMTDGKLSFLPDGQEVKTFNVLDGLGLKMLMSGGVETAIITGRTSPQVAKRAESLGINHTIQGREDKLAALKVLCEQTGHSLEQCAYIGDDLPDLSAIRAVAFGATVPNGHPLVQQHADWVTERSGGNGAAREFCEAILDAREQLEAIYQDYL